MNILIAGMKRSASTKLYNMVRLACEQAGVTYACFYDNYDEKQERLFDVDFQVVKIHKWNEQWRDWADLILTTYRPIQDAIVSGQRFGIDKKDILRSVEWLVYWNLYANNMFSYTQLTEKEDMTLEFLIKRVLKLKTVDVHNVLLDLHNLKPGKEYNPVTLLHPNHITNVKT